MMKSPLITLSAITGKPTRERIFEYLKGLKDNGVGQALIYPRSGCEIEYLSAEWFDTIAVFIESAQALDMYLWLYDDFNWPSGDAQGRVTAIEDYRLKAIVTKGDKIGTISCKSRHNSDIFGEKYFPDLLSYDAVDYFISLTHEEYYKRFGKYFGTVIRGISQMSRLSGIAVRSPLFPITTALKRTISLGKRNSTVRINTKRNVPNNVV